MHFPKSHQQHAPKKGAGLVLVFWVFLFFSDFFPAVIKKGSCSPRRHSLEACLSLIRAYKQFIGLLGLVINSKTFEHIKLISNRTKD